MSTIVVLVTASMVTMVLLVTVLLALALRRAGKSPPAVVWVAGFLGFTFIPLAVGAWLFVGSFTKARVTAKERPEIGFDYTRFESTERLFGPDVDKDLVRDARDLYGPALKKAEVAQMGVYRTLETVTLARFATPREASDAVRSYLAVLGLSAAARRDNSGGLLAKRAEDFVYAWSAGRLFVACSAPEALQIGRRLDALGITTPSAPLATE